MKSEKRPVRDSISPISKFLAAAPEEDDGAVVVGVVVVGAVVAGVVVVVDVEEQPTKTKDKARTSAMGIRIFFIFFYSSKFLYSGRKPPFH